MRSIILAGLTLLLSTAFHSRAATWDACEGAEAKAYNLPELRQFKDQLKNEFARLFAFARKSNQVNTFCLRKVCRVGDPPAAEMIAQCPDVERYFKEVLPVELRRYRLNLALSGWNVFLEPGNPDSIPFNYELNQRVHSFWNTGGTPVTLTPDELGEAMAIWREKSALIGRKVIREMEKEILTLRDGGSVSYAISLANSAQAREYLQTGRWDLIRHFEGTNPFLYRAVREVEDVFFKLNKKFAINQMLLHPVLPLLDGSAADVANISLAMERMEKNLAEEEAFINHGFDIMGKYRPLMADDVYPKIDYYSVVASLLNQNPALCPIAEQLWSDYQRKQLVESIGLLVITGGLFIVAPPLIGVAGGLALGAVFIYEDMSKLSAMTRGTFMSMQSDLNVRSADEDYLQAERLTTSVILAPLMASSVPAFKVSRALKLLK